MLELKDGIFYVGVKDEKIGAYNNAYLVNGRKTALIDTVSEEHSDLYIKNIEEIMPVKDIDYLICNHTEPDKSGAVSRILELNPDMEIVGTIAAIKNLKEIVNTDFNEHIAKNGAVIDLGDDKILEFCILPNLNWPDTMVTYEQRSKALFSCDIFSSYYDCYSITENTNPDTFEFALKDYYLDKIAPFSNFAKTAMEKLSLVDIECIYTGFGMIINNGIKEVIEKYSEWSTREVEEKKKVAVFYASNYGYTRKMAEIIRDVLKACGIIADCFDVDKSDMYTMISSLNSADALVFGSPTVNRNAMKSVWDIISRIDMVNMRNKPYFVFGSYGWGGEGITLIHKHLEEMKLRPFSKPFGTILNPSEEKVSELEKYVKKFAESIKK